jgi:hypothetical protein
VRRCGAARPEYFGEVDVPADLEPMMPDFIVAFLRHVWE